MNNFHYDTRLKQKQAHLQVKVEAVVGEEEQDFGIVSFIVLTTCQTIIIYFRMKIPGVYFQHSLREMITKCFHLHLHSLCLKSWQRKKPRWPLWKVSIVGCDGRNAAVTWDSFFPSHTLERPPRKSCQDSQGPCILNNNTQATLPKAWLAFTKHFPEIRHILPLSIFSPPSYPPNPP